MRTGEELVRICFLENENHAIVAWFNKGYADKQTTNKKLAQNVFVRKAPSGRELAPKATEGEREISINRLQRYEREK